MATVDDIDTKAVVNRFLQRQVITPAADGEADKDEEVQAVLESVAISLQLQPQVALSFIMRAKNTLSKIAKADVDALDFLIKAIGDINNPVVVVSDVSDLVEAQTALVELDRLQLVSIGLQAFQRYQNAVNRFLDEQLASSLKRKASKEFERNSTEAREDVFNVLQQYGPTHRVMADRLEYLAAGVSDFRSVPLDRLVSQRTLARVRESLKAIKNRFDNNNISHTTAAVELLGGTAAMESVSTTSDTMDATILTGTIPANRTIYMQSESGVQATALSSEGPWDVGSAPWDFKMTVDALAPLPTVIDLEIPAVGHEGKVYVVTGTLLAATEYDIPIDGTLYIQALGASTEEQEVKLTTTGSAVAIATIISELNAGLTDVTAELWGADRIALYGDAGVVTQIVIHQASPGFFVTTDPIPDPYDPYNTDPSIHDVLGFSINQVSSPLGEFSAEALVDILSLRATKSSFVAEGEYLRITSNLEDSFYSSLQFDGGIESFAGFSGLVESAPAYLELVEGSEILDPLAEGVFVGSLVTTTEELLPGSSRRSLNNKVVTSVDGTQISFEGVLPRGSELGATIEAPIVCAVNDLNTALDPFLGSFDNDFDDLRQSMSSIISKPTLAQVNDALALLNDIRSRSQALRDALLAVSVRSDRTQHRSTADTIISSLESRGLDRAVELLNTARFSDFFALTKDNASRANRFLTAMSTAVNEDIPQSVLEVDIDDDDGPTGSNEHLLDDRESAKDDLVPEL